MAIYFGRPRNTNMYLRVIKNLNTVGMSKMREYCTEVKRYKNFDRDISIIKDLMNNEASAVASNYGVSRQRVHQIFAKYGQIAENLIKEKET